MADCNCDYAPPEGRPCPNCRRKAIEEAERLMSQTFPEWNATAADAVPTCRWCGLPMLQHQGGQRVCDVRRSSGNRNQHLPCEATSEWERNLATNLWVAAGLFQAFLVGWNQRHVYQEQGCDPSRKTMWWPGCGHPPPWIPGPNRGS